MQISGFVAKLRSHGVAKWPITKVYYENSEFAGEQHCCYLQKRLRRWLVNKHRAQWQGLGDTQRQARELISGPSLGTRAKFMTFNRFQSRAVTGLLTGHNTLRRHLHLLGLQDSPLCRKCGVREETSAHILCECEALASLRHAYLGSFFWSRRILGA